MSFNDTNDHFDIHQSLDPGVVASAAVGLLSDVLQPALLALLSLWLLAGGLWAFLTHLSINSLRCGKRDLGLCAILTTRQERAGVPQLSLHAPGYNPPGNP